MLVSNRESHLQLSESSICEKHSGNKSAGSPCNLDSGVSSISPQAPCLACLVPSCSETGSSSSSEAPWLTGLDRLGRLEVVMTLRHPGCCRSCAVCGRKFRGTNIVLLIVAMSLEWLFVAITKHFTSQPRVAHTQLILDPAAVQYVQLRTNCPVQELRLHPTAASVSRGQVHD